MNLFGRELDGQALFALVTLSATLLLWITVWRRERGATRWLNWRLAERKRAEQEQKPPAKSHGGPWG